jgi:glycosyltransferase involved in cell wall biosynthesis
MRLVCVGPHPPLRSGVADYAGVLLPYLGAYFEDVSVVVNGYDAVLPPGLVGEVYNASIGVDWWRGGRAVPLYHMGNHIRYHRYVYEALRYFPGVTVLHDGTLLPFMHERTLAEKRRGDFVREVGFERGRDGVAAAWDSLRLAGPLDSEVYPMLGRVARASLGVIVHSQYLRDRVLDVYPEARVAVIPHLDLMQSEQVALSRQQSKESLGLDPHGLVVGAFGFIAPSKRLDCAMKALSLIRSEFPEAVFVCVGDVVPDYDFHSLVHDLGLSEAVRATGYVPMEEFFTYLHAVDVGVNLRFPTWGESSGTLLRLMACGVPTLVTDAGGFAEFPDEAVVKIDGGPGEMEVIEAALRELLAHPDRRTAIGQAAQAYVAEYCEPGKVAEQYSAFIRACAEGEDRADEAATNGAGPDDDGGL